MNFMKRLISAATGAAMLGSMAGYPVIAEEAASEVEVNFAKALQLGTIPSDFASLSHLPLLRGGFRLTIFKLTSHGDKLQFI